MSFFNFFPYSTPERGGGDRILPIIPNEIHLHIFEHLFPLLRRLDDEALRTLSRLSAVCRFYANLCLPRVYEYVELSVPQDDHKSPTAPDGVYDISSGTTLFSQIAANQPLALSLARCVRSCHFRNGRIDYLLGADIKKHGPTPKEYIVAVSQMTNIRELKFSCDFVNQDHWRTIMSLESLEELCFDGCTFLRDPVNTTPQQSIKLHIHRLQVTVCFGDFQPIAAIDAPFLRVVATDDCIVNDIDWLPRSPYTEFSLYLCHGIPYFDEDGWEGHAVLERVPQTIKTLSLAIDLDHDYGPASGSTDGIFDGLEDILAAPAWNSNLRLLRSLTLQFERTLSTPDSDVLPIVLDGIGRHTYLQSCVLTDHENSPSGLPKMLPLEIRAALHEKLGPHSRLTHIDCFGTVFHLVEGEWSEEGNSKV
ncbi:hypothetical protein JVU11DRAFT_6997 [Chiua virens]|nr:hypothetical protein JVU11DRAFT_6997 [Chiua virens]